MRFRVLGPVEVDVDGRVLILRRRQTRCLLGVLLLDLNRRVATDRLAEQLWDGEPPGQARRIIQDHVWRIRTALAEAGAADQTCELVTVGDGYQLNAAPESVDAHRFRTLVDSAATIPDPAQRADQLRRALDLWRGPVLDQAASDWLRQRFCTELEERRLAAWEDLASDSLAVRREPAVLPELARMAVAYPGRERLVELYMRALHRVGRKAEALAVYARTRTYLAGEFGIEPGPALRDRHRAILRDEPPAARPDPTGPKAPRQLPAAVGHFVGRTHELAALDAIHDRSVVVIAAIDGMAGIGKTALAVHAAHRIADRYPDGQLFMDLRGHTQAMAPIEPAEALDHALRALGVPGPQIPASLDQRAALYRTRLADQRMLILLDNAAAESQVAPLLPGAPGCLVLVTSRRRLAGLDHTHTLSLDTLPVPDAVGLFVHTAGEGRLSDQPPELLAELADLCGRLPLAIRIAAARLRSHPTWQLSHLVERLREQQHRLGELAAGQRSVTAALDLSYQQLSPDQQRTYRLLALHPGTDIDPYATAALLDSTRAHAARMLDQLHDAHLLLEPVAGRYRFHDLIRGHAAHTAAGDRSEPAGPELERLLDHYRHAASLALDAAYPYERDHRPQVPPASTPTPDLFEPAVALGWLDTELPNLLALARYASGHALPAYVLHLSSILHRHLRTRGHYHDAEALHQQALATARGTGDHPGELAVLAGLGDIYLRRGRYELAAEQFQQALSIARTTGHRPGELDALAGLGHVDLSQGRYERAAEHYQQARQIAHITGHRPSELETLTGLGDIHQMQARYEQAAEHYQQALTVACATGYRPTELYAHIGLGKVHRLHGRYEQAADHYQQALTIARATGDRSGELYALAGLGHLHRRESRYEQAAEHYEQALRLARTTGNRLGELNTLTGLGFVHQRQERYEQAADHYGQLLALAQEIGDRNFEFEALQGLGRLRQATGHPGPAITHHQQALVLAGQLGQPDDEARAHDGLAHAYHARQEYGQAHTHWRRALDILRSLDIEHTDDPATNVATIRAHLSELGSAGAGPG
jgi:tetratricopeptide (TPR) repeat protein/DNA-binding SARP family transcriptional activator